MSIVGSVNQPRAEYLGPRFIKDDNPEVPTNELLPLFARVSFGAVPINCQSTSVLKSYLLSRGVTMPQNTSAEKILELAHQANGSTRVVLHPSLVPQPAPWVGFEPLEELAVGDKYDDWVSICNCAKLSFLLHSDKTFIVLCRILIIPTK